MKKFTADTTISDLVEHVNWDKKFLDLVIPITQKGSRVNYSKLPRDVSPIEQIENEVSISLPSKQREIIYSALRYYRIEMKKYSQINLTSPVDTEGEDYYWYMKSINQDRLKKKVFEHYTENNNPKLEHLKTEITSVLEEGLNEIIDQLTNGIDDLEINFDTSTTKDVCDYLFKYWIVKEVELIISNVDLLRYLENRVKDFDLPNEYLQPKFAKLKWKGTPAQFGFLIIELIGKGYLEKPTSSYSKDANLYLDIFDIRVKDKLTTVATIAKEINDLSNSLSVENARLLTLPDIEKLK